MELIVQHLAKAYGARQALRRINLVAGVGVTALLGPNGSGKSTLLRILATIARPDAGTIAFAGRSYTGDQRVLRAVIGYLPQHLDLPGHMTPRTFLRYIAQLKRPRDNTQCSDLLAELGLDTIADRRLDTLSAGEIRRAGLAQALLHGAPSGPGTRLLLLDEPLAGLDPEERTRVIRVLQRRATGSVILLSTHVPGDIEALAQQVVVLRVGMVRAAGNIERIRAQAAGHVHELVVPVASLERYMQHYRISRLTRQRDQAVLRIVGALPSGMLGTPVAASLEDAYLLLQDQ